jgi:O-antigen/teichoic acid export membrane protein
VLDPGNAGRLAIRGGALRTIGYVGGLALVAGSMPLVVRHLGVADFGRYVLVTALISLVAGLTDVGVYLVGTREYSTRDGADRDRLMGNLLGMRIALSVVGALGAVGFVVAAGYDRTLVLGTAVAGVGLVAQSVQSLLVVPLVAGLRLGWATIAELVRQSVTTTATLGLVFVGASLLPFFAAALAGAVASLALTVVLVRGLMPVRPRVDLRGWWELLRGTGAIALAIAINVAYFRIAVVVVSLLTTALETGYFAASFRIVEVLLPIPALVVGAVFPILARAARDDAQRLAYISRRMVEVALIAGGGLALVLAIAAPVLVQLLAGDAGRPAVEVLRIQAPALLASFVGSACGMSLISLRRNRALLVANLIALTLTVGLASALVPSLGARGGALALLVTEWALALMLLAALVRALPGLELSLLTPVPMLVAAAVGGCALLAPVPTMAQAAVAAALYVAALFLTRGVPPEVTGALAR